MGLIDRIRDRLAAVPDASVPTPPNVLGALALSEKYLASDDALRSLELDSYWPKWDSPWWHMLLLFEMGEARRIPESIVRAMVAALDALPVKIFPARSEYVPEGIDVFRHTSCHCALGSMAQVLTACGVDVERELSWVRPWFLRYQMSDGGLNCDNDAYAVENECPSSMVGTVPAFEAMLARDSSALTSEDVAFVAKAAAFLMGRELRLGSSSTFNAGERAREPVWRELAFPRFYFYDVLRGLRDLARWLEQSGGAAPASAIDHVVTFLCETYPDGVVSPGRLSIAGTRTRALAEDGTWGRADASRFPLLDATSAVGVPSPWLTREWLETRASLLRSIEAGRLRDP